MCECVLEPINFWRFVHMFVVHAANTSSSCFEKKQNKKVGEQHLTNYRLSSFSHYILTRLSPLRHYLWTSSDGLVIQFPNLNPLPHTHIPIRIWCIHLCSPLQYWYNFSPFNTYKHTVNEILISIIRIFCWLLAVFVPPPHPSIIVDFHNDRVGRLFIILNFLTFEWLNGLTVLSHFSYSP